MDRRSRRPALTSSLPAALGALMDRRTPALEARAFRTPPAFRAGVALAVLASMTLVVGFAVGCGPAPRPRPATEAELRSLTSDRALALVTEVLGDRQLTTTRGWAVDIGYDTPLEVDLRIGGSSFGIEWVSPEDRARRGEHLPHPASHGQLRVLPGAGADSEVSILVLDHVTYRYDPDRERVQHGGAGVREVESRLQRDVVDFVEYARGQGGLR